MDAKEAISNFKEWYSESYGVKPTEKLIATFCKMKGIEIKPEEEVITVNEYKECSVLNNTQVVTNETTAPINHYSEANYKALETNYQNLLGEHEEVSAIAQRQKKELEDDAKLITKLSVSIGKLLNIMGYYKDLLSPSDIAKVEEIKKEVEP